MQLGDAAADEIRRHEEHEKRRRVAKLKRWLSGLFQLGALGSLLYLAGLVCALAGAPDIVVLLLVLSFGSAAIAAWVLGIVCAWRLAEWRWVAIFGVTLPATVLLGGLVTLPAVFVYPLPPLLGAIVYPWRRRREMFELDANGRQT